MKLLLLVLIALAVVWLFRSSGRKSGRVEPPSAPPPAAPAPPERETIIACAHCGLMLPTGEALPGRGGVFCSEAHRAAFEKPP